jgi:hypothetical protein
MIGKTSTLLGKFKSSPVFSRVASIASKALAAASILLGIQAVAKIVAPTTAAAADRAAAGVVNRTRRAGAAAADTASSAAQAVVDATAAIPETISTVAKWAAAGLAAVLLFKVL